MKKVFVTRNLFPESMARLAEFAEIDLWTENRVPPLEVLIEKVAQADGLLCMLADSITPEVIQAGVAHGLRVISQMAVGYDNIAVPAATAAGLPVGNTPGVLTETTADLAWALMMAAARRVVESDRQVHEGIWRAWGPDVLCGHDIYGATLGLIGFGRIGQAMAARARGFNMRVLYTQRHRDPAAEERTGAEYVSLDELLAQSDFVSLHAYLSPETRGMLGEAQFARMKPGAILVNTARGAMIDSAALARHLESGHLAAAGLDVFDPEPIPADSPLLRMPQVVITAHIGSASIKTRQRMAMMTVENIQAGLEGRPLPYCVNPEVYGKLK
jgi:Lactate dehydrogenase and related dehydrogenases